MHGRGKFLDLLKGSFTLAMLMVLWKRYVLLVTNSLEEHLNVATPCRRFWKLLVNLTNMTHQHFNSTTEFLIQLVLSFTFIFFLNLVFLIAVAVGGF
jgi:hypothetical protein